MSAPCSGKGGGFAVNSTTKRPCSHPQTDKERVPSRKTKAGCNSEGRKVYSVKAVGSREDSKRINTRWEAFSKQSKHKT